MKLQTNAKDLTGQRFGRLVVIEPLEERLGGCIVWLCKCDCGNNIKVISTNLTGVRTKSCGCLLKEKMTERDTLIDGTDVAYIKPSRKANKNSKSGHKGVHWNKRLNKWRAEIYFKGTLHYLGLFDDIQDAIDARKRAEEELFEPMLEKYDNIKGGDTNGH